MQKHLYGTKNTDENKRLALLTERRLSYLEEKIEEISESEFKNKKLDEIVDIVKKIIDFNNQNQEGKGLKILTPDQMLS